MVHGTKSGQHEDMSDVLQGWDNRIRESEMHNAEVAHKHRKGQVKLVRKSAKGEPLPSEIDPDYTYGLSTHDIDLHADPFLRSNAIIAQRQAQQEREIKREEKRQAKEQKAKPTRKIDATRPTAASIGHTHKPTPEPTEAETFKMKRFTQFTHGKIDTGLHKQTKKESAKEPVK